MHCFPEIREICMIGLNHTLRGESLKAFVVPNNLQNSPSANDVMQWCKQRMLIREEPTHIEIVKSIPKTSSGKAMWKFLKKAVKIK